MYICTKLSVRAYSISSQLLKSVFMSIIKATFLIVLLIISTMVNADTLKPFTTDGCSSFPDGTIKAKTLWLSCCSDHDYKYWKGGTYHQRLVADRELKQCVTKNGKPGIGLLMLAGVRVGGTPYLPTSFRWGYGWPYPRHYGVLNKEELKQVAQLSRNLQK